ncbi:unnamed protein product, partial [Closterium sp. Naga37s-1]
YDLGGAPFGSRKASFSLYASSGLSTSAAASEADLMRAVIVMPIQRINFTLLDGEVAASRFPTCDIRACGRCFPNCGMSLLAHINIALTVSPLHRPLHVDATLSPPPSPSCRRHSLPSTVPFIPPSSHPLPFAHSLSPATSSEVVAGSRKVGGLLFILPRHFSSSRPDGGQGEDDDADDDACKERAGEGSGEMKEHVEVVAQLEERLLEANIPVPVYFAVDNAELSKLAADVESNDRAGKPASATNGGFKLVVTAGEPRKLPASSPLPAMEAWLPLPLFVLYQPSIPSMPSATSPSLPHINFLPWQRCFARVVPGQQCERGSGGAAGAAPLVTPLRAAALRARRPSTCSSCSPPGDPSTSTALARLFPGINYLLNLLAPPVMPSAHRPSPPPSQWLASLDQSVQDRLEFAICLRAIGAAPGAGEGTRACPPLQQPRTHYATRPALITCCLPFPYHPLPPRSPSLPFLPPQGLSSAGAAAEPPASIGQAHKKGLSSAAAAVEPRTSVALVHKKVNISDARVPWQHELFSRRKLIAASLSALPSAPPFLRHWGGLADTRESVDEHQLLAATRLIAETIASHIFNSSSAGTSRAGIACGQGGGEEAALDPHYPLYSTPHARMHVYQVASITFDLVTFLAVAIYLSSLFVILHTATKGFDDLVALFKGKPAYRKAKPS